MPYQDKTLMCRDCGETFVFTAGEQEFFAQKGFTNEPSRCPSCRAARKQQVAGSNGGGYGGGSRSEYAAREMYTVPCSEPGCSIPAVVPFKPRNDKPVYCSECFEKRRQTQPASRW